MWEGVHSMEGFRYGDPKNWGREPQMWEGVHSMEGFRYGDPKNWGRRDPKNWGGTANVGKGTLKGGGYPIKTPKKGEGSPRLGVGAPK